LKYTLRHSLELKISLPQASLQSKLYRRDLSHPLSDPLDLQLKHFIDELCVFITLGDSSPR
jgi:energy-converting hydrogenase A subunit M